MFACVRGTVAAMSAARMDDEAYQRQRRLSRDDFVSLQEYTQYTKKSLKEVLGEYVDLPHYKTKGLTYLEFQKLLNQFLSADVGDTLTRSLFDSFRDAPPPDRRVSSATPDKDHLLQGTREQFEEKAATRRKSLASNESEASALSASATAAVLNSAAATGALFVAVSPTDDDSQDAADETDGRSRESSQPTPDADDQSRGAASLDHAARSAAAGERRACLSDIMCYLSLLEQGNPQSKLEFMFKLYDADNSGFIESAELHRILEQMITVAEYLGWDTSDLRPILIDMLQDIDSDSDGRISLEEWIEGGLHTVPLLVLLGLETKMKDGIHQWHLKHFSHPAYCNICRRMLLGLGKQGLVCSFCHYTVHERCVGSVKEACLSTYMKSAKKNPVMDHHWTEGNNPGKCEKCGKAVKAVNGLTGVKCSWCHGLYHNTCASQAPDECDLGENRVHILPPVSIFPSVLSSTSHHSTAATAAAAVPTVTDSSKSKFSFESLDMTVSPLRGTHPLIVFLNPKSGGKQGTRLISKFQYLLNPRQVYDLGQGGPMPGLRFVAGIKDARILCCGGDGTVGWVLACLDELGLDYKMPVGVLPLGTGNDMSRCLGWGGGYEGEDLCKLLKRLSEAPLVNLDRWKMTVEPEVSNGSASDMGGDPAPLDIINNYFSIGVDASIARKFHNMRETCPQKFNSRTRNKMWYLEFGAGEMFSASCKDLNEFLTLTVDGKVVDLSHYSLEGIAVLNIPSMYGGSNLWGTDDSRTQRRRGWSASRAVSVDDGSPSTGSSRFSPQEICDQLLEIVGLENSFHVGQIKAGLRDHGQRIAQGHEIVIETRRRFPMQVDGEPWLQVPCKLTIKHHNQVPMLHAPQRLQKRISGFIFRPRTTSAVSTAV
ncbi:diacylglycerol kinase beta-like isoform X2 [Sycon ciliatum]|uniref:diacylglycerol kinase beta-like isoform X2 n=1 Tax=Sycon ciliatum TaxID=27933 RepID=UPI0031F63CDF